MPILQIFRKDKKDWSQTQTQQVELYLTLHPFFSKFFEKEDFDKIINIIFYAKLQENQSKTLELNKKSQILILLSGQIEIYRKMLQNESKKKSKKRKIMNENFLWKGIYKTAYQVIELRDDVILKSVEGKDSEFLYLPTILYQTHYQVVKQRRSKRIIQALELRFKNASKRDLKVLAQYATSFKELKMNSYIYRVGEVPTSCYLLINGAVKIQSAGFSAKKLMEIHFVNEKDLFGQQDLNDEYRTHNAVCASSYCKILQIEKEYFNKFMLKNQQCFQSQIQKLKQILQRRSNSSVEQYQKKHILPKIRFHSYLRPEQQQKIQKQLIQNCHILINYTPDRKSTLTFRVLSEKPEQQQYKNQFQNKLKLFKRLKSKSRPISLTNKLF